MKKLLCILFSLCSFAAFAQQGSDAKTVYKSRVDGGATSRDTANAVFTDAIAVAVADNFGYFFWNAQATTPHWDFYTSTGIKHVFSFGSSSLTAGSGITIVGDSINWNGPLTEDVTINGAFDVNIGQTTSLTSFNPQADIIALTAIDSLHLSIGGTLGAAGYVVKSTGTKAIWGPDSGTGSVNTFPPNIQSGNYTFVQADTVRTTLMRSVSAQNLTIPSGMKKGSIFMFMQDSTGTVTLVPSGVTAENSSGGLTMTENDIATVFYKNSTRVVISKKGASSVTYHDKVTPTGAVNSSNVTFTLSVAPIAGSEHVYLNGVLQESGAGNDYTISGATITYLTAPTTGDKIRVSFRQ